MGQEIKRKPHLAGPGVSDSNPGKLWKYGQQLSVQMRPAPPRIGFSIRRAGAEDNAVISRRYPKTMTELERVKRRLAYREAPG